MESLKDTLPDVLAQFVPASVDVLLSHAIGAAFPRLGSVVLSYKLNRAERNLEELRKQLREFAADVDVQRMALTRNSDWIQKAEYILEATLDSVIDEQDIEKIRFFAQGTMEALTKAQLDPLKHVYMVSLLKQCTVADQRLPNENYWRT